MAKYSGSGWHKQSVRHSNARKYGKAGGRYIHIQAKTPMQANNLFDRLEKKGANNIFLYDWGEGKRVTLKDTKRNRQLVENIKGIKKNFGYAQRGFENFPINKEYSIEAHWEKTSRGFRHVVKLLKNGREVDIATENYLNRTWERFDYETAINKLLEKNTDIMTDSQRKEYVDLLAKKDLEEVNKRFGMIGAIAQMGEIIGKDQKEKNDWKERMIKAGIPQIQMPEDWASLSEQEKEKRLNKIIQYTQKKDYGKSSIYEFIKNNRKEIDEAIKRAVPEARIDDDERRLWILNDEGLYNWAKSEGVNI